MKRIILIVLRVIFKLPYWWFVKINGFKNKQKYPTIDEGYDYINYLANVVVEKGNVDLTVTGLENLPEGGYLITPNHQGLFDIVALVATFKQPIKFVLKKELTKTILIKDVVEAMEFYPLDRSSIKEGAKMVKNVSEEIKNGMRYVIFPEGTRSRDGNNLLEFKGGTYKIALKTKCPVVPVAFIDSYKVFDNNTTKQEHVHMHILPAITEQEYAGMKTTELATYTQEKIQAYINEKE